MYHKDIQNIYRPLEPISNLDCEGQDNFSWQLPHERFLKSAKNQLRLEIESELCLSIIKSLFIKTDEDIATVNTKQIQFLVYDCFDIVFNQTLLEACLNHEGHRIKKGKLREFDYQAMEFIFHEWYLKLNPAYLKCGRIDSRWSRKKVLRHLFPKKNRS